MRPALVAAKKVLPVLISCGIVIIAYCLLSPRLNASAQVTSVIVSIKQYRNERGQWPVSNEELWRWDSGTKYKTLNLMRTNSRLSYGFTIEYKNPIMLHFSMFPERWDEEISVR